MRISCNASLASFCMWKRSMVRMALGKLRLAIRCMELDISIVISRTTLRLCSSMRIMTSVTLSAETPLTMAMSVPFPARQERLVRIVYNSPLLRAVSSMQMLAPMFSGKIIHWSAWLSCSQPRKPLRWSLYCFSKVLALTW